MYSLEVLLKGKKLGDPLTSSKFHEIYEVMENFISKGADVILRRDGVIISSRLRKKYDRRKELQHEINLIEKKEEKKKELYFTTEILALPYNLFKRYKNLEPLISERIEEMKVIDVSTTAKLDNGDKRQIVVQPVWPENTSEAVSTWGEGNVINAAIAAMKVKLQASVRAMLEGGKSEDEIRNFVSTWNPEVSAPRTHKDPTQALMEKIQSGSMGRDQMEALLAKLLEATGKSAA